jgi:hypothetical protein
LITMDHDKLRAWWAHRQGLDGSLKGASAAEVLERSGWARSVAGVGPYLTLFSRAGISRADADAAVAKIKIHELPAARGCTYVVPEADYALALKVGQDFRQAEMNAALKLGVTEKEIEQLGKAVVKALAKGTLNPDEIRTATGDASRSLGEEGKKKGVTTTLPLALGRLQAEGQIRRVPVNGRLDQQRYAYALWPKTPLEKFKLTKEQAFTELARKFFSWIGPAAVAEFQGFAGLGVKTAKAAVDPLDLAPAEPGSDLQMLADEVKEFQKFKRPAKPQYVLVSSLDSIHAHRRDVRGLLEEKDYPHPVTGEKRVVEMGGLSDLPDHAILDRGRIVGLWEFDPEAGEIVWNAFVKPDKDLLAAIKLTTDYIRDQVGDARSFSLDSPKSRAPKLAAMRAAK